MSDTVIASGNLATARRTISGVLSQFALLGIDAAIAGSLVTDAGLPARAMDEPDFPISLQQELEICSALVAGLPSGRSIVRVLFEALPRMGIENLGVIGMAMRHAATSLDALKVCLTYPQLTMGHSRMVVRLEEETALFSFHMQQPPLHDVTGEELERLMEYCVVLDLTSSLRNIEDLQGGAQHPLWVTLPYPEPADWTEVAAGLDFPVRFSMQEACIAYSAALDSTPLPRANPLIHKMYMSLADKLSQMLGDEASLQERVMRWLWAYSPPLSRSGIADILAMSERNLTRQLAREGTSYSQLLDSVQAERARNYLRNRALSVAEIGYRLGYSEPAAFTRAFTRWTGQSPLIWRRQHADSLRHKRQ